MSIIDASLGYHNLKLDKKYVISCISQEQNLFQNFETSFCQFPTLLLPGLRKMLTSTISPTGGVTVMVRPAIF